jgi:hypothetical protein
MTERQIAALQAVADACFGCRLASLESVRRAAEEGHYCYYGPIRDLNDEVPADALDELVDELVALGMVRRETHKGLPHVGLTGDGRRCPDIDYLLED